MQFSIRFVIFAVVLFAVVLQSVYVYSYGHKTMLNRLDWENFSAMRELSVQLKSLIEVSVQNDIDIGPETLSNAIRDSSVISGALVISPDSSVLASAPGAEPVSSLEAFMRNIPEQDVQAILSLYQQAQESGQEGHFLVAQAERILAFFPFDVAAIGVKTPERYMLMLEHDISYVKEDASALSGQIILFQAFTMAGILFVLYYFFARRLARLSDVTARLTRHDYDVRSGMTGEDEIGRLGQAFDLMAGQLASDRRRMQYRNDFVQNVVDCVTENVCALNAQGLVIFANEAFLKEFGLSQELVGSNLQDALSTVSHDDVSILDEWFDSVMAGEDVYSPEYCIELVSGKQMCFEVWGRRLAEGASHGVVLTLLNITDKLDAQKQLYLKESAMEATIAAICLCDDAGYIQYLNPACVRMFGNPTISQVLGANVYDYLRGESHEEMDVIKGIKNRGYYSGELKFESGMIVRLVANVVIGKNDRIEAIMYSMVDITSQYAISAALQNNQRLADEAEKISQFGSWEWMVDTGVIIWSDNVYRIFGMEGYKGEITFDLFMSMVLPEDVASITEQIQRAIANPGSNYAAEHSIIRADGEVKVLEEQGKAYTNEHGEVDRLVGVVRDITDSRDIQKKLNQFKATLDMTTDCVFMFDADDLKLFYVNQGATDQVGYTEEELMQMTPVDIKPEFNEQQFRDMLEPLIKGQQDRLNFETIHQRKDGSVLPVEVSISYVTLSGESPRMVAVVNDITSRKKVERELEQHRVNLEGLVRERTAELELAQKELLKSEKLATLGRLTATVSHELRNPLGAIKPSLFLIKRGIQSDDERIAEALERINRNVSRCDHIIDELLDFTRSVRVNTVEMDFSEWLQVTLDEQILPENIKLDARVDCGLVAQFDPHQLRRVIVNLIENSCQAMHEMPDKEHVLTVVCGVRNGEVILEFSDTGPGVPDELQQKIFEPLFSTKGFGVGLGLPIVKQIIERHDGTVTLENAPGGGACFRLKFPPIRDAVDKQS